MNQSEPHSEVRCAYYGTLGRCKDIAEAGSQFCYWHDPDADKSTDDVKERLEARARNGHPMEGFILRSANLENIDLHDSSNPLRLINSDLSRVNLHKSHCYRLDLSGSRLLKANLSHANLRRACLNQCNLLGVNLKNCSLDYVRWGERFYQEQAAVDDPNQAIAMYEEAEESARNIRRHCEYLGMTNTAGKFYYRERVFHRMQLPLFSRQRLVSFLLDKISGYGESPLRVMSFSALLILIFSFIYFFTGVHDGNEVIRFRETNTFSHNSFAWLECLYFSVVTFTTLGYGDLAPLGISKVFAASEAFIGSFSLALFVVLFVKKMIR